MNEKTWDIEVEQPTNEECDERDYVALPAFDYACAHQDNPDRDNAYAECCKEKCPIRKGAK